MRTAIPRLLLPLSCWLASRLVLLAGMTELPALVHRAGNFLGTEAVPDAGWGLFTAWDSAWYQKVVEGGYEYRADGLQHDVAFFPLYPLAVRAAMLATGAGFAPAAVVLNNVAFLAGVLAFHAYVRRSYDARTAGWATAALCFYPYSLFGSVAYAEGLLLLTIVLALHAYEARRYLAAAAFGALATATKSLAFPLVPAFVLVAWLDRRGLRAAAAGVAATAGVIAFMAYCAVAFGDPLAFVHVQAAWRGEAGGVWKEWVKLAVFAPLGLLKPDQAVYGLLVAAAGAALLWRERRTLRPLDRWLGAGMLALAAIAGPMSIARFALVMVPLPIALGLVLGRHPRLGAALLAYFAVGLAAAGLGFALERWVA